MGWLEDFLELVDKRSFSRAAEARNVTQPAFSRRIRSLEEWVGTPLFERASSGTILTAAGKNFLRGAPDIVRRLAQHRREAREAGGRETASLRFAATHALSFTFFPQWIRTMEARGSFGPVRLISDSMQACEELMLHGQEHFLLCHQHVLAPPRLEPRQFRHVKVGTDRLVPLTAPEVGGAPRWNLEQGSTVPLLAYTSESGLGRITAAQRFEEQAARIETVFSAHLAATLLGMAREGRGVAWLPHSLAQSDLEEGSLVAAGGREWETEMDIALFRPKFRQTQVAEEFWASIEVSPNGT